MRRKIARLPVLVVGLLLLVACNATPGVSPAPTGSTPLPTSPTPTDTPTAAPSPSPIGNANVAIVRIEQTGGMLPPWMTLANYPSVGLYGDGRLIMQGPQIDIYPGPALPNLQVTRLTQAGVEQILAWAVDAGFTGPDRQLGPLILDSGVTLFTITSPDGTHRTSITDMSANDPEIGAAREFMDIMLGIRTWLANDVVGDDVPYAFDRLRLIVSPADGAGDDPLSSTIDWPLDTPIVEIGTSMGEPAEYRCALIEGEDLQTLMPLFGQANQLTQWRSEDELYLLALRPLLPDEEPCPGL